MSYQGRNLGEDGWEDRPFQNLRRNFIHHDFVQFSKQIRDVRRLCRALFCLNSVVKSTSRLLQ